MLGFCHLFAGIVIGLIIYKITDLRSAVIACGFGAILPDLIDKPLGHFILADSLNSGRIYAHTLLMLSIFVIIGLYYWKKKSSLSILAVSAGISSHIVLDEVWKSPTTLLWPFNGPFETSNFESYFTTFAVKEVLSVSEWVFAIMSILVLIVMYKDKIKLFARLSPHIEKSYPIPQIFLMILGFTYIMYGVNRHYHDDIVIGAVAILGGLGLLYGMKEKEIDDDLPSSHLNAAKR